MEEKKESYEVSAERICQLVKGKRKNISTEDAEKIAAELQIALDAKAQGVTATAANAMAVESIKDRVPGISYDDVEDIIAAATNINSVARSETLIIPVTGDVILYETGMTQAHTYAEITRNYIKTYKEKGVPMPEPKHVASALVGLFAQARCKANRRKDKGEKWAKCEKLLNNILSILIAERDDVCRISFANEVEDLDLYVYNHSGPREGIYSIAADTKHYTIIKPVIQQYQPDVSIRDCGEIYSMLLSDAKIKHHTDDDYLTTVGNGHYNKRTGEIIPFTPEIVRTSKIMVDLDINAQDPVVVYQDGPMGPGGDMTVAKFFESIAPDPELRNLLWEITQALCRPGVPFDKAIYLLSTVGRNGKGTLVQLWRYLVGEGNYASIPINKLAKDFELTPLLKSSALISDESSIDEKIKGADVFKTLATHDVTNFAKKYGDPRNFRFMGLCIWCLNQPAVFKDASEAKDRRELHVPMPTNITEKEEKKYIKRDFIRREDVLKYVLKHALVDMDYIAKFSEPECCKIAKAEAKTAECSVDDFFEEVVPECVWPVLPMRFLLDLYHAWYEKVNGKAGGYYGKIKFYEAVERIVRTSDTWTYDGKKMPVATGNRLDDAEPLIMEYGLDDWKNPDYKGNDIDRICRPALKARYDAIRRKDVPRLVS